MLRYAIAAAIVLLCILSVQGRTNSAVVADSAGHRPLPAASVFDRYGASLGISDSRGRLPYIPSDSYPITVRYLGFNERTVGDSSQDTIFMTERVSELKEVTIESRRHKVLHMLAYVREYSTLSTYTDTVFLFREKTVDYMITPDRKMHFKGWTNPRVLTCRSYYRFTNTQGLDSVSDTSPYHFSWSDWISASPTMTVPDALHGMTANTEILYGKYSPTEIWARDEDRVTIDVDVLADTTSRRWVPNIKGFFRNGLDFENFRVHYTYDNITGDTISPRDLKGYSFNIESRGRGERLFGIRRVNTYYVNTYAEVYMLDKEYITVKEAKKWEKLDLTKQKIEMFESPDAPALQPSVCELIARVENIDRDKIRTDIEPDHRLVSNTDSRRNFSFGRRALALLKQLTGITLYKSHKNMSNNWRDFRNDTMDDNNSRYNGE